MTKKANTTCRWRTTKLPRTPYSLYFSLPSYSSTHSLIFYSHTTKSISDFMSTSHEQQTELTNIDETKLTYPDETKLTDPDRTQLTNDNSTEINYTIRLVLASSDDLEKENDRPNI